jgi:hypothetical protein
MAGLVPAIHDFLRRSIKKDVDARDKPGHDGSKDFASLMDMTSRSRDAMRPRFAQKLSRLEIRGRGECRMRAAPAVSCAKLCKERTRAYRFSGGYPTFPAQWFDGL